MREETRYRVLYFVYFAALSGFGTFRNVYLNSIDLTGFEMGVIGALITVAGTFSQPFWGLLTDWRGAQREVLILTSALAGVAVLSYPLGARFPNPFVLIALGTVVYSVFRAPITPIIDSLALSTEFEYGDVRAFGSVAFGLGAFAYGVLISGLGSSIIFYVYSLGMFVFAFLARGIKDKGVETSLSVVEGEAVKLVK
ncbi:MAG: MFS transporter, partial [Halobacteria archaeon]|nr:MFS transporter [Halobacteria archaeon]